MLPVAVGGEEALRGGQISQQAGPRDVHQEELLDPAVDDREPGQVAGVLEVLGAIAQYGSDEFVGMTVTDTWFKANSAAAGGALYSEAAGPMGSAYFNMSCTSAGSGGMVGNQASEAGGAAYLNGYAEGSASMKVTVGRPCDFGEEDTVDDNLPEDIYLVGDTNFSSPSAAYSYGDGRTFSCMAAYSVSCSATD